MHIYQQLKFKIYLAKEKKKNLKLSKLISHTIFVIIIIICKHSIIQRTALTVPNLFQILKKIDVFMSIKKKILRLKDYSFLTHNYSIARV